MHNYEQDSSFGSKMTDESKIELAKKLVSACIKTALRYGLLYDLLWTALLFMICSTKEI